MSIILIVGAFLAVLIISRIVRESSKNNSKKLSDIKKSTEYLSENDPAQQEVEQINFENFEEELFKRTQAGVQHQLFLSMASKLDCMIIRSLLSAENIPTYVEGEHMNNIYGGLAGTLTAVIAIKLYILRNDYDKAFDIVREYINKKVEDLKKAREEEQNYEKAKNIAMALFLGTVPISKSEEILGITVFPKADLSE